MKTEYLYNAHIVNVVDGDTVDARVDLGFDIYFDMRLRLFGIDTPEMNSRNQEERVLADAAKTYVIGTILGKSVMLRTHKKDKFGRYLAEIFFDGNKTLNSLLIEQGFAKPYIR